LGSAASRVREVARSIAQPMVSAGPMPKDWHAIMLGENGMDKSSGGSD
jgi:hypothetical protein